VQPPRRRCPLPPTHPCPHPRHLATALSLSVTPGLVMALSTQKNVASQALRTLNSGEVCIKMEMDLGWISEGSGCPKTKPPSIPGEVCTVRCTRVACSMGHEPPRASHCPSAPDPRGERRPAPRRAWTRPGGTKAPRPEGVQPPRRRCPPPPTHPLPLPQTQTPGSQEPQQGKGLDEVGCAPRAPVPCRSPLHRRSIWIAASSVLVWRKGRAGPIIN
jgi:hypothetical protein